MAFWRKRSTPVDRAVEELDRQIASLQKQLRQMSVENPTNGFAPLVGTSSAARSASSAEKAMKFIKDVLRPPGERSPALSTRTRRDLFDIPTEPLKDLEAEAIAFSRKAEPDLFAGIEKETAAPAEAKAQTQIDCTTKPEEKLAHYLSAGSIKTYRPLKHVQRQTRNRFFMWLGLSLIALWVLYAVIR
ncbi:MAG: hypothetical protein ABSA97_16175 [Verrucomicrobiia bacterium]